MVRNFQNKQHIKPVSSSIKFTIKELQPSYYKVINLSISHDQKINHLNRILHSILATYPKGLSIDGFPPFSCACRISSLDNEARNHTVEDGAIVVAFHAQLDKIPACLWGFTGPQLDVKVSSTRHHQNLVIEHWSNQF